MQANGIPTLDFINFSRSEWTNNHLDLIDKISERFTFPVFVKPIHLGSSIGVKKVECSEDLQPAIEQAFQVDTDVLVETGVDAREIEFSVLGNDRLMTFPPGEILTEGIIYDFAGKYQSEKLTPVVSKANLPPDVAIEGQKLALAAFKAIAGNGMARVDFFLDQKGKWWLNEINPIPGFTKNSLYPMVCVTNGIPQNELVDRLIILGLQWNRKRKM
jgi:UDP-N-acetylmuramate--alanine ligase